MLVETRVVLSSLVEEFRVLTEPDVVVAGSADGRECPKRERALDLADRIVQDGLLRKSGKLSLEKKRPQMSRMSRSEAVKVNGILPRSEQI